MEKIEIKKVKENEVEKLQYIGEQTFRQTFEEVNSTEDMEVYLKNSFSLEKLKEELNNINSEFYFAIDENSTIVGYLKINTGKAQTEMQDNMSLEIERIYVLKEYQKQKVGKQLFERALHIALEKKMHYIWLGVWEKNEKAIFFYKKNGFIEFDKHIFKLGSDKQTDIMMKKELISGL